MKWKNYLIWLGLIAFSVALALLSCAAFRKEIEYNPKNKSEDFLSSLKQFSPEETKRDSLVKLYRFFEIVNDSLLQRLRPLNAFRDSLKIDSLIKAFMRKKDLETRPDTPAKNEWWEEMWVKRAGYCDTHYRSFYFGQWWDLRAPLVIIHGIPDEETQEEELCWKDSPTTTPDIATCQVFYLGWITKGIHLAFQDDDGDGCPDRFIPHKDFKKGESKSDQFLQTSGIITKLRTANIDYRPFEGVEKALIAAVNVASFPESLGFNTVWLSTGIPLNQIKPDSSGLICFHVSVVIYDKSNSSSLVVNDSGVTIYTPVNANIKWIPLYAIYNNIGDGKYRLVFTLRNLEGNQMGVYSVAFQTPPFSISKRISDILVSQLPPRNDMNDSLLWISRRGIKIMDNPWGIFREGETIYPYVEFENSDFSPDNQGKYTYLITCRLFPLEKDQPGKPQVITGKLYLESDSLIPFEVEESKIRKKGYLIYSSGESTGLSREIFTNSVRIPEEVPPGGYLLAISIRDVNKAKGNGIIAWRQITITK